MNKKAPIRAAIIEDEYPAARLLHKMLHEVRPDWEIILLPGSIDESVQWFNENPHPDILFLDIQLADGISFLFIERAQPESMIVFTTAYDQYAIRAFTVNSIDYLLKPIHVERLTEAIKKFERLTAGYSKEFNKQMDLNELMQALTAQEEKKYRTRFLISGNRKFYTIQVADIAYFYSEEKITFCGDPGPEVAHHRLSAQQAGGTARPATVFPGQPADDSLGQFHPAHRAVFQRKGHRAGRSSL